MKLFAGILSVAMLVVVSSASAAVIRDGRYNVEEGVIELNVVYAGGCKEHQFQINLGGCLESMPVQCGAALVDLTTDDFCEALVGATVKFTLEEAGMNDPYFARASVRIMGDYDSKTQQNSSVTIQLP